MRDLSNFNDFFLTQISSPVDMYCLREHKKLVNVEDLPRRSPTRLRLRHKTKKRKGREGSFYFAYFFLSVKTIAMIARMMATTTAAKMMLSVPE